MLSSIHLSTSDSRRFYTTVRLVEGSTNEVSITLELSFYRASCTRCHLQLLICTAIPWIRAESAGVNPSYRIRRYSKHRCERIEERLPPGSSPPHRRLLTATPLGLQWSCCCRTRRCPGGYIGTGFQKLTLVEALANDKDVRIGAYWNEAGVGLRAAESSSIWPATSSWPIFQETVSILESLNWKCDYSMEVDSFLKRRSSLPFTFVKSNSEKKTEENVKLCS